MNSDSPNTQSDATETPNTTDAEARQNFSFEELAGGRNEITIEFEGQRYRLRATKNGRLLLNK